MDNLFFLEAKCVHTNQTFYIRYDKAAGGVWCQTYGVKGVPVGARGSITNKMEIDLSKSTIGPQYKCPYCGNESFVRCGTCHNLTCMPNNTDDFKCAHCGKTGKITGYIKEIDGTSGTGQG